MMITTILLLPLLLLLILPTTTIIMVDGMAVTVDRDGNLIRANGNNAVPGGGSGGPSTSTHPTVPFHCDLDIQFFEGEVKEEPTDAYVEELINKFEYWVTNLFSTHVGDDVFLEYAIDRDTYIATYDAPDNFSLKFTSAAILANEDPTNPASGEKERMTNTEIVNLLNDGDYASLVRDYIWKTEPREVNSFYHTHGLELQCLKGSRPPHSDNQGNNSRRRFLLLRRREQQGEDHD